MAVRRKGNPFYVNINALSFDGFV